jgi:signal transduction histidine kinase
LQLLLDELIPLVLPAARHTGVTLSWQPSQAAIIVLANRELLSMVIVNLLLNAIEAAQKLSHTKSAQVQVRLGLTENHWAELEVNDTGAGLADAVAEKLFQPFVTTKAEGVGLGLAVGQQVAQAHGGEIVWSRTNNQTCFRLRLPLMQGLAS